MIRTTARNISLIAVGLLLLTAPLAAGEHAGPGQAGFERLKALEGTWTGQVAAMPEAEGEAHTMEAVHEFRVSANGTVVMETMGPGTPHEMINMYHLDGDDLVLTHYCAGGNQPRMKLVAATENELSFDFTGGSNLDPAVDHHIHAARLMFMEDGSLKSDWDSYKDGKPEGTASFHLQRADAE